MSRTSCILGLGGKWIYIVFVLFCFFHFISDTPLALLFHFLLLNLHLCSQTRYEFWREIRPSSPRSGACTVNSYKSACMMPRCLLLSCLDCLDLRAEQWLQAFVPDLFWFVFTPLPLAEQFRRVRTYVQGGGWASKTCHPPFSLFTHCNSGSFWSNHTLARPSTSRFLSVSGASMIYLGGKLKSFPWGSASPERISWPSLRTNSVSGRLPSVPARPQALLPRSSDFSHYHRSTHFHFLYSWLHFFSQFVATGEDRDVDWQVNKELCLQTELLFRHHVPLSAARTWHATDSICSSVAHRDEKCLSFRSGRSCLGRQDFGTPKVKSNNASYIHLLSFLILDKFVHSITWAVLSSNSIPWSCSANGSQNEFLLWLKRGTADPP